MVVHGDPYLGTPVEYVGARLLCKVVDYLDSICLAHKFLRRALPSTVEDLPFPFPFFVV